MSQALKIFVSGMGQTLDLGATRGPRRKYTGSYADYKALRSDWEKVGKAMSSAMRQAKSGDTKISSVSAKTK